MPGYAYDPGANSDLIRVLRGLKEPKYAPKATFLEDLERSARNVFLGNAPEAALELLGDTPERPVRTAEDKLERVGGYGDLAGLAPVGAAAKTLAAAKAGPAALVGALRYQKGGNWVKPMTSADVPESFIPSVIQTEKGPYAADQIRDKAAAWFKTHAGVEGDPLSSYNLPDMKHMNNYQGVDPRFRDIADKVVGDLNNTGEFSTIGNPKEGWLAYQQLPYYSEGKQLPFEPQLLHGDAAKYYKPDAPALIPKQMKSVGDAATSGMYDTDKKSGAFQQAINQTWDEFLRLGLVPALRRKSDKWVGQAGLEGMINEGLNEYNKYIGSPAYRMEGREDLGGGFNRVKTPLAGWREGTSQANCIGPTCMDSYGDVIHYSPRPDAPSNQRVSMAVNTRPAGKIFYEGRDWDPRMELHGPVEPLSTLIQTKGFGNTPIPDESREAIVQFLRNRYGDNLRLQENAGYSGLLGENLGEALKVKTALGRITSGEKLPEFLDAWKMFYGRPLRQNQLNEIMAGKMTDFVSHRDMLAILRRMNFAQ